MWVLSAIGAFARIAPRGRRYTSDCYWCGRQVAARSQGVAEFRMCYHIGSSHPEAPESPDQLSDDVRTAVENGISASLVEVGQC